MYANAPAVLGIDVSKTTLVGALLDTHTREVLWHKSLPNTPAGIAALFQDVTPAAPCVVEPTGRYSRLVVQQGHQAGRTMLLAPTRAAKAFLASLPPRAKTDRLDSRGLAQFALSQPLRAFPLPSEPVEHLRQRLSARKLLARSRSSLHQQQQELPHAAPALQAAHDALSEQIARLDKEIAALVQQQPAFAAARNLQAVPGVGPVTAAALTACLASKPFAHADAFVAYVGLDVGVHQSGQHKGRRGLTHQGDAELRRLLYLCAQANLRCKDSPFKTQYERERTKGLSTTAALCAVARKLARLCWSLHKNDSTYAAARVTTPLKREKAQAADTNAALNQEQTTPKSDLPLDSKP